MKDHVDTGSGLITLPEESAIGVKANRQDSVQFILVRDGNFINRSTYSTNYISRTWAAAPARLRVSMASLRQRTQIIRQLEEHDERSVPGTWLGIQILYSNGEDHSEKCTYHRCIQFAEAWTERRL